MHCGTKDLPRQVFSVESLRQRLRLGSRITCKTSVLRQILEFKPKITIYCYLTPNRKI